eukprot:1184508-Prorocentrum_minimum.AAC.1
MCCRAHHWKDFLVARDPRRSSRPYDTVHEGKQLHGGPRQGRSTVKASQRWSRSVNGGRPGSGALSGEGKQLHGGPRSRCVVQCVRGTNVQNAGVTNVVSGEGSSCGGAVTGPTAGYIPIEGCRFVCLRGRKGKSGGRGRGTGQGGEKRGRVFGALSAPLPLLAQEDP